MSTGIEKLLRLRHLLLHSFLVIDVDTNVKGMKHCSVVADIANSLCYAIK